jgi:predicted transposase YbfD/YdcC
VLSAIDPKQFHRAFQLWVAVIRSALGATFQIAVDGQCSRGSANRAAKRGPVHTVSAYSVDAGIVLGQERTFEKSNEIEAIPALLCLLDLRDVLVSIDAAGCQTKIADIIVARGGDYLLALKKNQTSLYEQTKKLFDDNKNSEVKNESDLRWKLAYYCEPPKKSHGRVESRSAWVITEFFDRVPAAIRFKNISCLIKIESTRKELGSEKESTDVRYYISSREMTAKEALVAVRNHWLIENQLHWCLDVSFRQDKNRTRTKNAAENLATVRHIAFNILRQYQGDNYSIARRRSICGSSLEYLCAVFGISYYK